MFGTIEKGLLVFKKEFRDYLKTLEGLKRKYGNEDVFGCWDEADYSYVMRTSAAITAMERALGLSEKEVNQIEEEIKFSLKRKGCKK